MQDRHQRPVYTGRPHSIFTMLKISSYVENQPQDITYSFYPEEKRISVQFWWKDDGNLRSWQESLQAYFTDFPAVKVNNPIYHGCGQYGNYWRNESRESRIAITLTDLQQAKEFMQQIFKFIGEKLSAAVAEDVQQQLITFATQTSLTANEAPSTMTLSK